MTKTTNEALVQMQRRAERVEASRLVATFVDAGPLFTLLSNTDHQVMYGRRGTGKTHALKYLGETVLARREHSIYVDMRTVGSNGGLYADTNVATTERGTRLWWTPSRQSTTHSSTLPWNAPTAATTWDSLMSCSTNSGGTSRKYG
jgi:hypothetical protein